MSWNVIESKNETKHHLTRNTESHPDIFTEFNLSFISKNGQFNVLNWNSVNGHWVLTLINPYELFVTEFKSLAYEAEIAVFKICRVMQETLNGGCRKLNDPETIKIWENVSQEISNGFHKICLKWREFKCANQWPICHHLWDVRSRNWINLTMIYTIFQGQM